MKKQTDLKVDYYIVERDFNNDRQQCMRMLEQRKDIQDYAKTRIVHRAKNEKEKHKQILDNIIASHEKRQAK